jgi:hypothetical protein
MTENEIEVLGFDPTQLDVFNENESPKGNGNPLIYKTKPANSVSEDGVYRATIKVVYNPFNIRQSVLEQQSYAMQDANGWFTVVSSLTKGDKSCPIFSAWKKCHYAKKDENYDLWKQAAKKEEGGNDLFDKRYGRYVIVQILEDKNQPDLVGKFLFWKMPKSIWDIINAKMAPSVESKKAKIPVMDFLFGRSIDLEVTPGPKDPAHPEREQRETKYSGELSDDAVACVNPDGSPLLNDNEQAIVDNYVEAMTPIWKSKNPEERATLEATVNADPNTAELRKVYSKVLEQIKGFCPNLIDELGYKPWDDTTKARVNAWISVVLSGNNPAENANVPTVVTEQTEAPTQVPVPTPTPTPVSATDDNSDDLPF